MLITKQIFKTNGQLTHTAVSEPAVLIESSSNGVSNCKPRIRWKFLTDKVGIKTMNRSIDFLAKSKHENLFSSYDKKLTFLINHLFSAPHNLLKVKYDERARRKPAHGRTLSGALTELDRALHSYDMHCDVKTKLEILRMGNNKSFGDFFA